MSIPNCNTYGSEVLSHMVERALIRLACKDLGETGRWNQGAELSDLGREQYPLMEVGKSQIFLKRLLAEECSPYVENLWVIFLFVAG